MRKSRGRSWKLERASVSRRGRSRPRSNKYRPTSDSGKRPRAGARKRIWVGGHMRGGTYVRGHYRTNPHYSQ